MTEAEALEQEITDDEFAVLLEEATRREVAKPIEERYVNGKLVVWAPQEGSQVAFLDCPLFEVLYHGTRGPGKTDALLMDFAQHVDRGHGEAWRGIIFRETYAQLADLVAKSVRWFRQIFPTAKFVRGKPLRWEFEGGEVLYMSYMRSPDDYWNYHGHEYPWIAFEELTNWGDDRCYKSMFSCCRSSNPDVPRKIRATTNPYGIGHNWVKERFRLHGKWWTPIVTIDSKDLDGNLEPPRVAIHGHIDENKLLLSADPNYKQTIAASAANKAMAEAWLNGSWKLIAGGMFSDVWDDARNNVPEFEVPATWRIDRAFDWGSSRPFSVGWYAQSDGSDLTFPDGTVCSTVRGDLFRIKEWYGWTGRANEGLRMLAVEVAEGIVEREILWGWRKTGDRRCRVLPGPADGSIYTIENTSGRSIGIDMEQPVRLDGHVLPGVAWTRADKSPGSRKSGWEQMRAMIRAAKPKKGVPREAPALFVVGSACPQFLRTVLALPRDEKDLDDVDTESEDHCFAGETLVLTPAGAIQIDCMAEVGVVFTDKGPRPYDRCGLKITRAECVEVTLSDGGRFTCTPDHKVWTVRGWMAASTLSLTPSRSSLASVSTYAVNTSNTKESGSTGLSGSTPMDRSRTPGTSTTLTTIGAITSSRTLSACKVLSTWPTTGGGAHRRLQRQRPSRRRLPGTDRQRASNGIASILKAGKGSIFTSVPLWSASNAGKPSRASLIGPSSAIQTARRQMGVHAVSVLPVASRPVYCLRVPSLGRFLLASGVLVSNCGDEVRYRVRATGVQTRSGRTVGMH